MAVVFVLAMLTILALAALMATYLEWRARRRLFHFVRRAYEVPTRMLRDLRPRLRASIVLRRRAR